MIIQVAALALGILSLILRYTAHSPPTALTVIALILFVVADGIAIATRQLKTGPGALFPIVPALFVKPWYVGLLWGFVLIWLIEIAWALFLLATARHRA